MKEKLSACVSIWDSYELFKSLPKSLLEEFIGSLEKAKEYIDLTMRDDFLLMQAKQEVERRTA